MQTTTPLPVHYLPIATTIIAAAFVAMLVARASKRRWAPHLVWWAIGIFFYGLGTAVESTITLHGNTETLNRIWYWVGAILGGYPLGTGSLYLLARRRVAHTLTAISLVVVIVASVAVMLTPIDSAALEPYRPSGHVLEWQWVRLMTPFINLYAVAFLVGGAVWSSVRFATRDENPGRALGTALIAVGGILPGIGGAMTKAGMVEALYVGELTGLMLIIAGYQVCVRSPAPAVAPPAEVGEPEDAGDQTGSVSAAGPAQVGEVPE